MDAWSLTQQQTRWIETCARRLMALDTDLSYGRAVELGLNLLHVWPILPPCVAAESYLAPITA